MPEPTPQDIPVEEPVVAEPEETQEDPAIEEYIASTPIEGEPEVVPEEEIEDPEEDFQFPVSDIPTIEPTAVTDADITRVAREVIAGQWGSGEDRQTRLFESNYNYEQVQAEVNAMLDSGSATYRNYSVQPGDTLKSIARRIDYKGEQLALFQKNRGIVGDNPNVALTPGQVLSL